MRTYGGAFSECFPFYIRISAGELIICLLCVLGYPFENAILNSSGNKCPRSNISRRAPVPKSILCVAVGQYLFDESACHLLVAADVVEGSSRAVSGSLLDGVTDLVESLAVVVGPAICDRVGDDIDPLVCGFGVICVESSLGEGF